MLEKLLNIGVTPLNSISGDTNGNRKERENQFFYFMEYEMLNKLRSTDTDLNNATRCRRFGLIILIITAFTCVSIQLLSYAFDTTFVDG